MLKATLFVLIAAICSAQGSPQNGSISGRVTSESGDPRPDVRIDVAQWIYVGGQKSLTLFGNDTSNAEGTFSIAHLPAGFYFIRANSRTAVRSAIQAVTPGATIPTYYPGVIDPSKATAVQLPAGGALRDLQIHIPEAGPYHVRGKVVSLTTGKAPALIPMRLSPKDAANVPIVGVAVSMIRDGNFDFGGVSPGVYVLEALPGQTGFKRGDPTLNEVGWQIITVGNADVDNVVFQIGPGAEITGKFTLDGAMLWQSPGLKLDPIIGRAGSSAPPRTLDNGTFAIHDVMPSVFKVSVLSLPKGTYVKSVRSDDRDLMKTALDLTSRGAATVNIDLATNVAEVTGVVRDADGKLAGKVAVSLWAPGVPAEGSADLARTILTDTYGRFQFADLPPGEYRIAAWEGVAIPATYYAAPEFRIKFESKAATVKLDEGGHQNIEVPMIDRGALEMETEKLHLSAASTF